MPSALLCPAKINLFLEVVGKRPDGYHELETVFQAVDLCDRLSAAPRDDDRIVLSCDRPDLTTDDSNLVIRAAQLLRRECGLSQGITFHLEKSIPMGAGLGGGSSDAAAALRVANELWRAGLSPAELAALGAKLGSDIAFFTRGGACIGRGRGERLRGVPSLPSTCSIVLALTAIHSDTASAYAGLRLADEDDQRRAAPLLAAVQRGDMDGVAQAAFNRFAATIYAVHPQLGALGTCLERLTGVPVLLSGSGSALWFFGSADEVKKGVEEDPVAQTVAASLGLRLVQAHPLPDLPEIQQERAWSIWNSQNFR